MDLSVVFNPTFDFARAQTHVDWSAQRGPVATSASGDSVELWCPGVQFDPSTRLARVHLRQGQDRWFVLTFRPQTNVTADQCVQQLATTLDLWEQWASRCTYAGPYPDLVLRSALALKLLTYEQTGAIVAAPTTSLPERIGGHRNWDYRFTWLRDSSLIVDALHNLGYAGEAADFAHFLERTLNSNRSTNVQIMYGIDGRRHLTEHLLDHLDGYRGSRPVRIGNAAAQQRQIDIYGEVVRAVSLHYMHVANTAPDDQAWSLVRDLVNDAANNWTDRGSGIWEVRDQPEAFVYGKLMCWAALDCGLRLAEHHHLDAPLDEWRHVCADIRNAICEKGFNPELGAFTQAFGSDRLDATALIIPRIGFLPPTDERVASTVKLIQGRLTRDGLVYRTEQGLAGGEGTFTLCSFWLVEALALAGRIDDAHAVFRRATGYVNDLGLLAEEFDPHSGEQLGNFPQGFSHLGLIGAAVAIARAETHPKVTA